MRLGLIGDIHGNAGALKAVLEAARVEGIDALCVTGDLVGYYYEPDRVLDLLADWTYCAVRGNHEDMLLAMERDPRLRTYYLAKYGSGLEHALEKLDQDALTVLERLPRTRMLDFAGRSLLLAHGTPWDTDEYLYPDAAPAIMERVAESGADFIVLGHTHHQFDREVSGRLIVNPGSVGQPRDRKPGAAWSILEVETGSITHRRENYDIGVVMAAARHYDPDLPYNWTVLSRA